MSIKLKYELDLDPASKWNMISTTAAAEIPIYVQEVGDFRARRNYYTSRQGFDSFLIKITTGGAGRLKYDNRTWNVPANHFFFIDCSRKQNYRTDPEEGYWNVLWVHFYGSAARYYYRKFLQINNDCPVGKLRENTLSRWILRSILSMDPAESSLFEWRLRASTYMMQLLAEIMLSTIEMLSVENAPKYVLDIHEYLQEHYTEKLTLDALGKKFALNPGYLQKQYKRYFGRSPIECQLDLRHSRAKELMRTTHKSIGEISTELGFESPSYFARQFKQLEGITPQEFRHLWPIIEAESSGTSQGSNSGSRVL